MGLPASNHRPYVIIGNGAAGVAAVQGIRQLDARRPITVITREPHGFYSKPGLAYWLTGQIPEKQLYPELPYSDAEMGVTRLVTEVEGIDPGTRTLKLEGDCVQPYHKLLIATGAQAIRPKLSGIDLDGVVTLDTLDDARRIVKLARRAKRAVIVGGGITALELAEGLCARGVETHYLLRKDRYWSNVLDGYESHVVEERLREEGVRVHYRAEIERIEGKKNRVAAVALRSGERIACTIVGVAIGIKPRTEIATSAGLKLDRGILVDESLTTSEGDIYAAGDVAQVWDPETATYVLDSLWWIAREQGLVAGRNIAGAGERYQRKLPFNVTRIGGLTTTIIGRLGSGGEDEDLVAIARGDSETWRTTADVFAVKVEQEHDRVRLLVGERHLEGALVMGDQALSRPLQGMIAGKVDVSPIRQRLVERPHDLVSLIETYWSEYQRGTDA